MTAPMPHQGHHNEIVRHIKRTWLPVTCNNTEAVKKKLCSTPFEGQFYLAENVENRKPMVVYFEKEKDATWFSLQGS